MQRLLMRFLPCGKASKPGGRGVQGLCWAVQGSSTASMLGLLALAVWVDQATGRVALSSLVFAGQWLVTLLWPRGIAWLTEGRSPTRVASLSEMASVGVFALCAIAVWHSNVALAVCLASLRGFTDALTRAAASVAARTICPCGELADQAIASLEFRRIVGTATAGVVFSLIGASAGPVALLAWSAGVFGITAIGLRHVKVPRSAAHLNPPGAPGTLPAVHARHARHARSRRAAYWLGMLGVITAFQGLHNAIRVAYPMSYLGQGVAGVGVVSALATVGVLLGAWLSSGFVRLGRSCQRPWLSLTGATVSALALAFLIREPRISYLSYFAFMVAFELAFMRFNLEWVAAMDPARMGSEFSRRAFLLAAAGLAGLAVPSALLYVLDVRLAVALSVAAFLMVAVSIHGVHTAKGDAT